MAAAACGAVSAQTLVDPSSGRGAVRVPALVVAADGRRERLPLVFTEEGAPGRLVARASQGAHDVRVVLETLPAEPTPPGAVAAPWRATGRRGPGLRFDVVDRVGPGSDLESIALEIQILPALSGSGVEPAGWARLAVDRPSVPQRTVLDDLPTTVLPFRRADGPDVVLVARRTPLQRALAPLPDGLCHDLFARGAEQAAGCTIAYGVSARQGAVRVEPGTSLTFGGELVLATSWDGARLTGRLLERAFTAGTHVRRPPRPWPPVPGVEAVPETSHPTAKTSDDAADGGPDCLAVARDVASAREEVTVEALVPLRTAARGFVGLLDRRPGSADEVLDAEFAAQVWTLVSGARLGDEARAVADEYLGSLARFLLQNLRRDTSLPTRYDGAFFEPRATPAPSAPCWALALLLEACERDLLDPERRASTLDLIVRRLRGLCTGGPSALETLPTSAVARTLRTVTHAEVVARLEADSAQALCRMLGSELALRQDTAPIADNGVRDGRSWAAGAVRAGRAARRPVTASCLAAAEGFAVAFEAFGDPAHRARAQAAWAAAAVARGLGQASPGLTARMQRIGVRVDRGPEARLFAPLAVQRGGAAWSATVFVDPALDGQRPPWAVEFHQAPADPAADGRPRLLARTRVPDEAWRAGSIATWKRAAVEPGDPGLLPPDASTGLLRLVPRPPTPQDGAPPPWEAVSAGGWHAVAFGDRTVTAPGFSAEANLRDAGSSILRAVGPSTRARRIPSGTSVRYALPVGRARGVGLKLDLAVGDLGPGRVRVEAGTRFVLFEDPEEPGTPRPSGGIRTVDLEVRDPRAWPDGTLQLVITALGGDAPVDLVRLAHSIESAPRAADVVGATVATDPAPFLRLAVLPVELTDGAFPHGLDALRNAFFDETVGPGTTPPPEPRASDGSLAHAVQRLSGGLTTLRGDWLPPVRTGVLTGDLRRDPEAGARTLLEAVRRAIPLGRYDAVCVLYGAGPLQLRPRRLPGDEIEVVFVPATESDGSIVSLGRLLQQVLPAAFDQVRDCGEARFGRMGSLALTAATPPGHTPPDPLGTNLVALGWSAREPLIVAPDSALPRAAILTPTTSGRRLPCALDGPAPGDVLMQRQLFFEIRERDVVERETATRAVRPEVLAYWRFADPDRPLLRRVDGRTVEPTILRLSAGSGPLETPFVDGSERDLIGPRIELDDRSRPSVAAFDGVLAWTLDGPTAVGANGTRTAGLRLALRQHRRDLLRGATWWVDVLGDGRTVRFPTDGASNERVGAVRDPRTVRTPRRGGAAMVLRAGWDWPPDLREQIGAARIRGAVSCGDAQASARLVLRSEGRVLLDHTVRTGAAGRTIPFEADLPTTAATPCALELELRDPEGAGLEFLVRALEVVPVARPRAEVRIAEAPAPRTLVGGSRGRLFGGATAARPAGLGGEAEPLRAPLLMPAGRCALRLRMTGSPGTTVFVDLRVRSALAEPFEFEHALPVAVGGPVGKTVWIELPPRELPAAGQLELRLRSESRDPVGILDVALVDA